VPTLATCTFNKRGLILIIFGRRHQHTFKNDMHIQFSLFFHFYLLYLLLNSCDGNDTFWHHSVLVKQSSSFSGKCRTFVLISSDVCLPNSSADPEIRLTTKFGGWWGNVWHMSVVRATNSLPKKHIVSCPFHRSYLKANKISKSEGIRKVEYTYYIWKCADAVYQKIVKISPCLSKLQLVKFGTFSDTV